MQTYLHKGFFRGDVYIINDIYYVSIGHDIEGK
jgi:hypothetical protein